MSTGGRYAWQGMSSAAAFANERLLGVFLKRPASIQGLLTERRDERGTASHVSIHEAAGCLCMVSPAVNGMACQSLMWMCCSDAQGPVSLRPRIALAEKAAKQQHKEHAREKQQRMRQALAELDQTRLSKLHPNQVSG